MRATSSFLTISALGVAGIASAWSLLPQMVDHCRSQERSVDPRVQQVAEDALGSLNPKWSVYSACENTGRPGAGVGADVYQWRQRAEANRYLAARGWTRTAQGPLFVSPDGFTTAHVIKVEDSGEPIAIHILFTHE